ncbi:MULTISPECIES: type I-E CRISPR-associated endonuclease Cas1e [unclassified Novosphingobium]|uniref:type I-E CRISPR-associated endonuclease Cas1e n=1 Tax=unclassified Novosphingobium TaxID=2644732 RepID=UPI00144251C2|nr:MULTISPECIES: type I-E CRISPR-associated endonuclease Cas1e [unclassified Novosphingobium]MBB3358892.1 CRISPR-associated protein Cas1 [Novosphingobium sp. BK256]MBB3375627.1 CRISPR-associated protein Cas1 [Novosphingobium sp. BK280]MBB3379664.1 CRISPR-associated protein Cas1 [Novosphingobium sp. BK258]MBB3421359.1 CRISPR-associated protein Cas1 [Novosphingobium sp. BK267]MBB3449674.1 CRISPR-associated protein Cas1 [Novosphingobium sp. BK352]
MLAGRLGLEKAHIPHVDRHGLVWLDRGRLEVEAGCLRFVTAGGGALAARDYQIPHQAVSIVLLGPGSSVTHDALRLLARHGCALAAIGEGAVRFYTAPPLMPDSSALARAQARAWADPAQRMAVARAMYALRFGEIVRTRDIEALRGQEGARIKRAYALAADRFGVRWAGRHYDRADPEGGDLPNQAINHAGAAMTAAASVAVAAVGAIPQLGFVHEDSGQSFVLDIADLHRHDALLDIAFGAVAEARGQPIERVVRQRAARLFRQRGIIPTMIDQIKSLLAQADEARP